MANGWIIETKKSTATEIHNRPLGNQIEPTVSFYQIERKAMVLGSTQKNPPIDIEKAKNSGFEICKRQSGGGLVTLIPEQSLWVDVEIPTGSKLWQTDVGRAFDWLGAAWVAALKQASKPTPATTTAPEAHPNEPYLHQGKLLNASLGGIVCFAGLGPGEITINASKVLGVSQRRTRSGARFQCLLMKDWDNSILERYLKPQILDEHKELGQLKIGLNQAKVNIELATARKTFCANLPQP